LKRLLLFPLILLTGCSLFVKTPVVSVKDVTLVGLDGAGARLEVLLGVTNPNAYHISLQGYTYALQVMDVHLASGEARQYLEFAPHGTADVRIPVQVAFRDLFDILKRRPDMDHVPYRIKAGLDVKLPVGSLAVPLDKSGTFAIPLKYRPATFLQRLGGFLDGGPR
jgi:LEA14-like dessication related protein